MPPCLPPPMAPPLVLFDPCLTWCNHVNSISSRISKRIGLIRRIKFFLPISALNKLSNALVMPHVDYCSSVWSSCNVQYANSQQILQNRLTRVLVSADIRTRIINQFSFAIHFHHTLGKLLIVYFDCSILEKYFLEKNILLQGKQVMEQSTK